MNFRVDDLNLKVVQELTERQALTLRGSYYDEDSQVTYSGLTLAEWRGRPAPATRSQTTTCTRYRWGTSATHRLELNPATTFTHQRLLHVLQPRLVAPVEQLGAAPQRSQRPGLRRHGQPRHDLRQRRSRAPVLDRRRRAARRPIEHGLFGVDNVTEAGVRYHYEDQYRIQANGDRPNSREPGTGPQRGHQARTATATSRRCRRSCRTASTSAAGPLTPGLRFETRRLRAHRQPARHARHERGRRVDPRHSARTFEAASRHRWCSPACTAASRRRASPTS
ncbi:MAG: hypothetical protein MZV70_33990 [Desulfobacterales bacterium]|nr:hypothetical protein [Desulfobacterales bacterium]